MKLTKRLFTAGVALALTLSLNVPAFAATITIDNAVDGQTYKAYKIFDVTTSTSGDKTNYSYTLDASETELKALLEGAGLTLTPSADGSVYMVTAGLEEEADAANLAEYLNENITKLGEPDKTGVGASGTATITNLDKGYYFVDSSLGSLCILDTTEDSANVKEKNSLPSIVKKVKEDSNGEWQETATIDVTDTIEYQLTVNTGTGYKGLGNGVDADYVITDKLPTGITYTENSIAIKDWTAADYTVTYNTQTNTLTITLKQAKLADLGQNKDIVITYKATAAGNLAVDTEHKNTVTLTYKGQNPTDNAVVKTYDIKGDTEGYTFTKVDGATDEPMEGVEFVLSKTDNGATKYATFNNNWLTGWVDAQESATPLTTDENGHIYAYGLDADTYTLTETYTLPGYNLLTDTITVTIDEGGNVKYKYTTAEGEGGNSILVENMTGTELPSTGGMGTTVLYIAGVALALGAGITLVVRRRMNSDR